MDAKVLSISLLVSLLSTHHLKLIIAEEGTDEGEAVASGGRTEDAMTVGNGEEEDTRSFNDAITVWMVENGNVTRINAPNYAELDASRVYIVRHQEKPEVGRNTPPIVFYWVGKRSSDTDAIFAAEYAVSNTNFPAVIRREAVDLESALFKAVFKVEDAESGLVDEKKRDIIEVYATRMIMIRGNDKGAVATFDVREVEFSLECVQEERVCCVAFNSSNVFTYCGTTASYAQRLLSRMLADLISKKVVRGALQDIFFSKNKNRDDDDYLRSRLTIEFEYISQTIKDHEIFETRIAKMTSEDTEKGRLLSTNDNITILRVDDDADDTMVKEVKDGAAVLLMLSLNTPDCYLVDSCAGRIGLLVWLGKHSRVEERKECAKRAEMLLKEKKDCDPRPIIFIDETRSNLGAFPKMFGSVKNLIDLMRKLNLSWEDILLIPAYSRGVVSTY